MDIKLKVIDVHAPLPVGRIVILVEDVYVVFVFTGKENEHRVEKYTAERRNTRISGAAYEKAFKTALKIMDEHRKNRALAEERKRMQPTLL
ncbi:MAG: hypothetical protein HY432_01945 [Candidatus Liptonbacteria bacterium]|nr:hypothetical protein [Candidatus Liptonbacteria bacterium]